MEYLDLVELRKKIDSSVTAAVASGVLVAAMTVLAFLVSSFVVDIGVGPWVFVDVLIIGGLTYGTYRRSRVCAVLLFVFYLGSKLLMWVESGQTTGLYMTILFLFWMGQGVWGTYRPHRVPLLDSGSEQSTTE